MATAEASLNLIVRASDEASEVLDTIAEGMQGVADMLTETVSDLSVNMQELLAQMMEFQDAAAGAELQMTDLSSNLADQTVGATGAVNDLSVAAGTAGTEVGTFSGVVADTASPLGALTADLAVAEAGSISLGEGADTAQEAIEGVGTETTAAATSVDALGVSMGTAATETDAAMTSITSGVDGAVTSMDELATGAATVGTEMATGITAGADEADTAFDTMIAGIDELEASIADAAASFDEFAAGMTAGADEAAAGVTAGTDETDAALDDMAVTADTAVESTKASLGGIGPAAMAAGIGLIAGLALDKMMTSAIQAGSDVYDLSKELGVSGEEAEKLSAMFDLTDTSSKTVVSSIARITKALDATTTTTNATKEAFEKWGISVSSWDAADAEGKIGMLATAYTNAGANANDFLDDVLGPRGAQLAPMLAQWATDAKAAAAVKFSGVDPSQMQAGAIAMAALELQFKQMEITVASALVPAIKDMSTDFEDLAAHANVVVPILIGIGAAATAYGLVEVAIKGAAAAQATFNLVMDANPIALIVIAVAALAVGAYELLEHWSTVSAFFENLWSTLSSDIAKFCVDGLELPLENAQSAVQANISAAWNAIKRFFESIWNGIKTDADTIWTGIKNFFVTTWTDITTDITTAADGIISWLQTNWTTIAAILTGPIGLAVLAIADNWGTIKSDATAAWNDIASFLESAWNDIVSASTTAWDDLENGIKSVWKAIVADCVTAYDDIMEVINKIVGDIDSAINAMKSLLGMGGGGASVTINPAAKMAEGGLVNSATLALIGESGPEAVVPLGSSFGADLFSSLGGSGSGGGGNQTVINIQCSGNVTSSEEALANVIMQKIMEKINLIGGNLDATWATGR